MLDILIFREYNTVKSNKGYDEDGVFQPFQRVGRRCESDKREFHSHHFRAEDPKFSVGIFRDCYVSA